MTDIVEELRTFRTEDESRYEIHHQICDDAADEILRLRGREAILAREVDELRAELEAARKDAPDAKRYRWYRDRAAVEDVADLVERLEVWGGIHHPTEAESAKTDAAIDSEIAKG